jgi:hypothetical protein
MAEIIPIPELAFTAVLAGDSAQKAQLPLPQYNPQYKQDRQELQKIDAPLESESQVLRAKDAARAEEQLSTNPDRTAGSEARRNNQLAQTAGAAAAISPPHSAHAGLAGKVLLRLFGMIGLGVVAAVIARKLFPHVCRRSLSNEERCPRVQRRTVERTVAQSPRDVPAAPQASPAQELAVPTAEPAAAAAVISAPNAPPPRQAAPEPAVTPSPAPQWPAPDRAVVAPPPIPQPAPVVAVNRQTQPSPQPAPVAPAPPRVSAPLPLRFAPSASQPTLKPPTSTIPSTLLIHSTPAIPLRPRIEEPMSQPASQSPPQTVQQRQKDTPEWLMENPPWWMTATHNKNDPAAEQPRAPRIEAWYAAPAHGGQKPAAEETRKEENLPGETPTRLSALRGIHFSMGVREFSPRNDAARDGNGLPADAPQFDPRQTMIPEASIPLPEHEPVEVQVVEMAVRTTTSRSVTAEPEVPFPPAERTNAEETTKVKESRWNRAGYETGGDDIQILPSRPGQYNR